MTVDGLKGAICEWFNGEGSLGVQFVKSPVNAAAPVGNYVAVAVSGVEQYGSMMEPPPGDSAVRRWEQVATVRFTEVEGDGDVLRQVRNALQRPDFVSYCRGLDFTVWGLSGIMENPTWDGEFVVRQHIFTARFNFEDAETFESPKVESVDPLTLNGEE